MKRISLLIAMLFFALILRGQVFPVETILDNGLASKRIKYVFLSDGYQSGELTTFIGHVNTFKDNIFTQTPYKEYKNFFNFYAIKVPSVESGADHPGTASDEGSSGGQPTLTANTYFNSTFDYASIHRLVVPQNNSAISTVMANNFPSYNQIFIFANSTYYGGSGGTYATSTVHTSANEIAIHEIGHSFAGLADEYAIGGQGERPNRTTVTDPATIKWKNWVGTNSVGIYPIGVEGWQRPHQNCKMQFLGVPFCSVCKEAFINKIYALVTPIYDYTPTSSSVTVSSSTTFSATVTQTIPNTIKTEWKLNGASIATNVNSVNITPAQLNSGANTLTLYVTDETALSRSYLPNTGYIFSQTWTLNRVIPLEMLSFTAEKKGKDVVLNWQTTNERQTSHFDVQRSTNGKQFFSIGKVKSKNQTTTNEYSFWDKNLPDGTLYYRLEQFDIDGKSTFSPIRSIEKSDKFYYEISPNPTSDVLTISGNADYDMEMTIEMFNEIGTSLYQKKQVVTEGVFQHTINMSDFANGSYFVVLRLPNGFSVRKTVVKTN
ncbi:MAG: hypothetical protein JNL70_03110 [Saprospiraceae bacterium]|nr:hypothetical protein [Saprospiraceae bacterium]